MNERVAISLGLMLCFAACADGDTGSDTRAGAPCAANASVACACPGGAAGAQTCQADGTLSACVCPCAAGFAYAAGSCADLDECATGLNTCHPDATCVNLYGSFLCRCDGFYEGDGQRCQLDECRAGTDTCDPLATCTDLDPGFSCACPAGYEGSGTVCTDIDECARGLHDCVQHAGCTNLPGSFRCACLEGFRLQGGACVNVDECGEGLDACAAADGVVCVDRSPGYACVCGEGYLGDGTSCTPDAATMVRDISDRPATLEVTGIGTFRVAGLSRVGWDVEVIQTPTIPGRTHKEPGLVTVPEVTLRKITGTPTLVSALVAWARQGALAPARTVTLGLEGLGAEIASVAMLEVRPQSVDSATTPDGSDVTLAQLVLRLPDPNVRGSLPFTLASWSRPSWGPGYPQCPLPGHLLEFQGLMSAPCYPLGVLKVPLPKTSEPLLLPGVRDGQALHDWARTVANQWLADPATGFERKAMSVIDCAYSSSGCSETSRVNLFEVFPARFDFFDPTRPYGYEYLFQILIVDDFVEQA